MAKHLSSKNKIIIAFATLSVFIVAGIVSLVLVLAASRQQVSSNISVTYVSNNVSAQVTGKYWYDMASATKTNMYGGTNGTLTFNAGDATGSGSLMPNGDIALTAANKRVVFEYAFKNLSTTSAFTVELTGSPRIDGIASNYSNITEKYYVSAVEVPVSTLKVMEFSNELNIQPIMKQRAGENDTVYIYVVAEIADLANDAEYAGAFNWSLDYVAPANIQTVNLNNNGGSTSPATMEVVTLTAEQISDNKIMNMPAVFEKPTYDGKGFDGYYDATSEGTEYISFNGTPMHANDLSNGTTLYATWLDLYEISGSGVLTSLTSTGSQQSTLDIPASVNTIEANVFKDNANIQEINLPTTLVEIGDNAFEGCTNLTEINFDSVSSGRNLAYTATSNLTRIGSNAFKDCTGLETIVIPGSATLEPTLFSGCTSLRNITAPIYYDCNPNEGNDGISLGYFDGLTDINLTINANITELVYRAFGFEDCACLVSITLPNSVETIRESFQGCNSLRNIDFGTSLKYIYGDNPFKNCYNFHSLVIPASVEYIDRKMGHFLEVYNLSSFDLAQTNMVYDVLHTSIDEPSCIRTIDGVRYFIHDNDYICLGAETSSVSSVTISNLCTNIYQHAFGGYNNLVSVTFSEGSHLVKIDISAFYNCTSLTSIIIPDGVTSIEAGAFYECYGLTSITIPSSVTRIGNMAFSYCTSLTSIIIPDGVTSIGTYAFSYCTSLTSITIPDGVTSIGSFAFPNCTSLTSITIPDSVTSIGFYAFWSCNRLKSITIESSTIAGLASSSSYLLDSATTVYVKDTISTASVGAYITGSFTLAGTSDKAGYNMYTRNS